MEDKTIIKFFQVKCIALIIALVYLFIKSTIFAFNHPNYTQTQLLIINDDLYITMIIVAVITVINVKVLYNLKK